MLAIYEQSLCIKYYDAGQGATGSLPTNTKVLDSHCKIVPIQQDLATIRGCKLLFDAIPGSLTSGHRKVSQC
jgi:hypothetical protein